MKTSFHVRTIVIAGFAMGLAAGAAARIQEAILTTIEVRHLVQSTQPEDQARLRDHFTALADRYGAEAREHRAMARAFLVNPGRRVAANRASEHCKRLADLAAQSAETVRALAAHHGRLAVGIPSTPPENSARFEAGEGAEVAWEHDKAIHDLAANARTVSDHRALETYFAEIEKRYSRAVNEHLAMAQAYRAAPNRLGGDPAAHCDRLVRLSREAAREAGALAAEHRQAAESAR
jgi:hypothetical protein